MYSTLQNKCKDCTYKTASPIPKKGRATKLYETWRDMVAKPYLDKRFGLACSKCGVMPLKKDDGTYYRHDVDHKQTRGAHADKKMDVKNIQYMCRRCHRIKTDNNK